MPTTNPFENEPEEIGTFVDHLAGERLREGITKHWPASPVTFEDIEREGHSMQAIVAKTDPITVAEMRAFVQGFFTAYNNRHAM